MTSPNKKLVQKLNTDLITDLPEPLIIEIISWLETKEAVKTSILSKKWKHLWTGIDKLVFIFNTNQPNEENYIKFLSFVDQTLNQCTCKQIKTFSLAGSFSFSRKGYAHKLFDKWLHRVCSKNLEFLKLELKGLGESKGFGYSAPYCIYDNSCLVTLELDEVEIDTGFLRWGLLKTLCLKGVLADERFFEELLSRCLVLETLVLENVVGFDDLNVTSKSVKRVKLVNFGYDNKRFVDVLKISAPGIRELEICGEFVGIRVHLMDVSSLKKVTLTVDYVTGNSARPYVVLNDTVWKLLFPVCHVDELVIGPQLVEAYSLYNMAGKYSPLLSCRHLTIDSSISKYEFPGIACLLRSTFQLESLVVNVSPSKSYICKELFPFKKDSYSSLQGGSALSLRYVSISYVSSSCPRMYIDDEECLDYEVVAYILANASTLEKLIIIPSKLDCSCTSSMNCVSQHVCNLVSKLLCSALVKNKAPKWELKGNQHVFEFIFCKPTLQCSS